MQIFFPTLAIVAAVVELAVGIPTAMKLSCHIMRKQERLAADAKQAEAKSEITGFETGKALGDRLLQRVRPVGRNVTQTAPAVLCNDEWKRCMDERINKGYRVTSATKLSALSADCTG